MNNQPFTQTARNLRHDQTDAENLLWYFLEDQRLFGQRFLRHYRVGSHTLSFYCPEKKLAIELVDLHSKVRDSKWEIFIKNEGIRLLQFDTDEVFNRAAYVFRSIEEALNIDPSP